jgi:uncharacterized protein (DUF305 family)
MRPSSLRRRVGVSLGAVTLAGLLAGTTAAPATARPSGHVRHDVVFAQMLVPHHLTAIRMGKAVRYRATNREVRALAAGIVRSRTREVAEARQLLRRFGAKAERPPAPIREVERQDLRRLKAAKGVRVDCAFLGTMRHHHIHAIAEGHDELVNGRDAKTRRLAARVDRTQLAELSKMNRLHARLCR